MHVTQAKPQSSFRDWSYNTAYRMNSSKHYTLGTGRANEDYGLPEETHIYYGAKAYAPERPMCERGWNRDYGTGFSIWRQGAYNPSFGVMVMLGKSPCSECQRRTIEGLDPIPPYQGDCPTSYSPLMPGLPLDPDGILERRDDIENMLFWCFINIGHKMGPAMKFSRQFARSLFEDF